MPYRNTPLCRSLLVVMSRLLLPRSKAKNAQEAHEAIRPTNPALLPSQVPGAVPKAAKSLYELIWRRTVASQMANAKIKQVSCYAACEGLMHP